MQRRILARLYLLDLLALGIGMVLASWIVFGTPIPWQAPSRFFFGRPGQGVSQMIVLLFGGMTLGSWFTARAVGRGVPRPSYGRAVSIVATMVMVPALVEFFIRDAIYYSARFVAISAAVTLTVALAHRAVARSRPWSETMVLITHEKRLMDDLYSAPHAQVIDVIDPAGEEAPSPLPAGTTLAVDLRAVLSDQMAQFVSSSNLAGYPIRPLVDVYEEHTGRLAIVHLAEGWELRTPVQEASGYVVVKRVLDVLLVLALTPFWIPLSCLVWLAVKLDSRGPAVFKQTRIGHHGRPFTLYKFRTMWVDAEANGPQLATVDDPRLTRVGRALRKVRADELPQLWNVLKGDLSLVGPRPEQPAFVERFSANIPFYDYRHLVRPGLAGWAQVNYGYADDEADTVEKLTYDLYYVKHMSPWLDLQVLGKSVWTVLSGYGAQ